MLTELNSAVPISFDKPITQGCQPDCLSKSCCAENPFQLLPPEIILHIFSFLSETTLVSKVALVNKEWKFFVNTDLLWRDFFKKQISGVRLNHSLTWKESYSCQRNLERGLSREKVHSLGEGVINRFNIDAEGRLLIEKIVNQEWKIEVWDSKKIRRLQQHTIKDAAASDLASDGKSTIYTLWHLLKDYSSAPSSLNGDSSKRRECWKLNFQLVEFDKETSIQGYAHLGEKPIVKYIDLYQNHAVIKINHVYLFIFDLIKKKPHIIPLKGNNSCRDLVFREEGNLWMTDDDHLQLYDILNKQCKKEIPLPTFDQFHSAALMKDRLIVLKGKQMLAYEIVNDQFKEMWSIPIENGRNKTLIISKDLSPYFGVYQDKKLVMYEVLSGKALCEFQDIPTKQIVLDIRSFQYLNEKNELVTRLFGLKEMV